MVLDLLCCIFGWFNRRGRLIKKYSKTYEGINDYSCIYYDVKRVFIL